MGPKAFLRRLYQEYEEDSIADCAAALSYYFLFSLFPFLFFLATLTAFIPYVHRSVDTVLARAHAILPAQAVALIESHLRELIGTTRPHLLTLGLVATVYSASRGVDALRKTLNQANDVKESRKWWRTELVAIGMTIGGALLTLIAVAAVTAGGRAGLWLARRLGIAHEYVVAWSWLRWPVTALAIMSCAALAYHVLPDLRRRFRLVTPGSVLGTLLWLLATWGFQQYVAHFGSYNVTYGSIGGVIVLLTWFYISGFIFLMGAEVNAILDRAAREDRESRTGAAGREAPAKAGPARVPPPFFLPGTVKD